MIYKSPVNLIYLHWYQYEHIYLLYSDQTVVKLVLTSTKWLKNWFTEKIVRHTTKLSVPSRFQCWNHGHFTVILYTSNDNESSNFQLGRLDNLATESFILYFFDTRLLQPLMIIIYLVILSQISCAIRF